MAAVRQGRFVCHGAERLEPSQKDGVERGADHGSVSGARHWRHVRQVCGDDGRGRLCHVGQGARGPLERGGYVRGARGRARRGCRLRLRRRGHLDARPHRHGGWHRVHRWRLQLAARLSCGGALRGGLWQARDGGQRRQVRRLRGELARCAQGCELGCSDCARHRRGRRAS